jgi:hypothetical protein
MVPKVSVGMDAWIRPEDSAFQQCNDHGIYYGRDEYTKKKKFKGFPLFFVFKILKQPYFVI